MKRNGMAMFCGLVLSGLLVAARGYSQSNDDLKKDIQALKEGQQAIQKDLQEIKKLIAARPAGGGLPRSRR